MSKSVRDAITVRTNEEREWAERMMSLPAGSFEPLAVRDPALAADLFRVLGETIVRAIRDWGVRPQVGTLGIEIAGADALGVSIGEELRVVRWDGTVEDARRIINDAVWSLADQWKSSQREEPQTPGDLGRDAAWAHRTLDVMKQSLAGDLKDQDGGVGLQIAIEITESFARHSRSTNHITATNVLENATERQLFFALYCLGMLASEAAPTSGALKQLRQLAETEFGWPT